MHVGEGWVILRIGDIGYKVFIAGFTALSDQVHALYIYDLVREDRRELYGFEDQSMLELFEKLIDISGVGPKLAVKILAAGSAEKLKGVISGGDIEFLTSISGVGKKTAQKIILELKGVLAELEGSVHDTDTLEALMSLGYSRKDCNEIIPHLKAESPEDRIREALKLLSSHG